MYVYLDFALTGFVEQVIWFDFWVLSLEALHERLKVVLASLDVHRDRFLLDLGVWANDHDIGRRGELINEADEFLVSHDHGLELIVSLDARELELLDDVRDFLEAMIVLVIGWIVVRDH